MHIGIFAFKVNDHTQWDPTTVRTGITGSEEAIIYLSDHLARLGHRVTVFADPPRDSLHSLPSANPRYVDAGTPTPLLDVAVAWRVAGLIPDLCRIARKVYFWPHDVTNAPLPPLPIDDILWLSHYQRRQWLAYSPHLARYTRIFGNGVNPDQFYPLTPRTNPYSCIYGSNYARGLDLLLDIWPTIKAHQPRATLDIYYGWKHWGLLSPAKEARLRHQIAHLPDVVDHGLVGHDTLNRAYAAASLWTYPCTLPETFCITALRAQLSGAIPVILDGTALTETVRHGYRCQTRAQYTDTLLSAMAAVERITVEDRKKMGQFIVEEYSWAKIAGRWSELFAATA